MTGDMEISGNVPAAIKLDEGTAEVMGDGMCVVLQRDEQGRAHSVTLSEADLGRLLAAA